MFKKHKRAQTLENQESIGRPTALGSELRRLREARGLYIQTLADRVGVSTVTIWKWETGAAQPRRRNFAALAKALHLSVASLTNTLGSAESVNITGAAEKRASRQVVHDAELSDA